LEDKRKQSRSERLALAEILLVGLALNFVAGGVSGIVTNRRSGTRFGTIETGWFPAVSFAVASVAYDLLRRYGPRSINGWGSDWWIPTELLGVAILVVSLGLARKYKGDSRFAMPELKGVPVVLGGFVLASIVVAVGYSLKSNEGVGEFIDVTAEVGWLIGLFVVYDWLCRYLSVPWSAILVLIFWMGVAATNPSEPLVGRLVQVLIQVGALGLFARKHRTAFGLAFGCIFFVGVEIAVLFSRQVAGSFYG
jgi:hypothetical protein